MSLVNKVLRDLDARRAGDGERAALPAAVTPLASYQEPGDGATRLWPGVVLAFAGLGAAAWYVMQSSGTPESPPAPVVAKATAAFPPPAVPVAPAPLPVVVSSEPIPSLRMAGELSEVPALPAPHPRKTSTPQKAPELPAAPPQAAELLPSRVVEVKPPVVALPKVPLASGEVRIEKQVRVPSAAERAESEYRRGMLAQRQGNMDEAASSYREALEGHPEHAAARQSLAALLIEARRFDEAEELLRKGTELASTRLASTLALARLKVERNQVPAALELLQKHAAAGERSAEYQGFAGALLNRAGRAAEAAEYYQAATRLAPGEGRWWAGLGIALDAAGKAAEARAAYQKARSLPGLPADLAQHIEQRLH